MYGLKCDMMNKYWLATLRAIELLHYGKTTSPVDAWEKATIEIFGRGTPSQEKGCPKITFLALCGTGRVKGIKAGTYTKSEKNKSYALKALELIEKDSYLARDPNLLWEKIMGGEHKAHNGQMHVVLSLWHNDLIVNE